MTLSLLLMMQGCIEQYYPEEDELKTGTMVVVAHLTNQPGIQSIYISRSSTIQYPEYDPVSGCYVEVVRLNGDSREFEEANSGCYSSILDDRFLQLGEKYSLVCISPDGDRYVSEYEELQSAVDLESVYWERELLPASDPDEIKDGIRFYLDFEIDKEVGNYLRWEMEETYEIHNPEYTSFIFDLDRVWKEVPDSGYWRTCWISGRVPGFVTLNLDQVEGDIFKRLPLCHVDSRTRRLQLRYSLLVRQFSMSESAFRYWDDLRNNISSSASLFDTQPALAPGNVCNAFDEEEVVLGFFSISGVSEKRIFVDSIPDLKIQKDPNNCYPQPPPVGFAYLVRHYPPNSLPVFLSRVFVEGLEFRGIVEQCCVDCRAYKGSSHIKPDFW